MEIEYILFLQILLVLYICFFFRSVEKSYKILLGVFVLGFYTNLIVYIIYTLRIGPSSFTKLPYILYSIIGFSGILLFFKMRFKDRILDMLFIFGIIVMPLIVYIREFYFGYFDTALDSNTSPVIGTILIVAACLRALLLFIKRADNVDLYKKLDFWVVLSILIFHLIQFVYLGYLNFAISGLILMRSLINFFNFSNLVFYIGMTILIIGFNDNKRNKNFHSII